MDPERLTLPIYLDQPAKGCILPMLDFIEAGEVHPLGTPPPLAKLNTRRDSVSDSSFDATMSVGLFGMGGVNGGVDWTTKSWRWCRWGTQATTGTAGTGYEVAWGFGYRLHVQSLRTQMEGAADAAAIGFKTRVNGLQTSFAAETFGITDHSIYKALPLPDGYDANTFAAFDGAMRQGLSRAENGELPMTAVPMGVLFDGNFAKLAVNKALAVRFAAARIKEGKSEAEAVTAAAQRELPVADIKRVYALWNMAAEARHYLVEKWLWSGDFFTPPEPQSKLEGVLIPADSDAIAVDGLASAIEISRFIVRSQLLDLTTSGQLGYGGPGAGASGSANADAKRLVYEAFTRQGPVTQSIENGVAHLNTKVSGLIRINCVQSGVDAKMQGTFSGIAADASVNRKNAEFEFIGHGFKNAIDASFLGTTVAGGVPSRLVATAKALQLLGDSANHDLQPLPANLKLQFGAEREPRAFPSARAIIHVLEHLRDGKPVQEARARLKWLGLEQNAADAIYQWIWPAWDGAQLPTAGVQASAKAYLQRAV